MNILRFIFPVLFIRNWETGEYEISRPRMIIICGVAFLFILALIIIYILQAPESYIAS